MERNLALEMESADFGDARLTKRAALVVAALAAQPGASLPKAMGNDSALEALYRLIRNPKISLEKLLAPHFSGTAKIIDTMQGTAVVAHDTTEFAFPGRSPRENLGELIGGRQGFHGHVSLALEFDAGGCRPIGVLDFRALFRQGRKGKRSPAQIRQDPESESRRWWQSVQQSGERLAEHKASVVHVMDREADDFALFENLIENQHRFVIRASHDRAVAGVDGPKRVSSILAQGAHQVVRSVQLSQRHNTGDKAKHHPSRDGRVAQLMITGHRVEVLRPKHLPKSSASSFECNFVEVSEIDCPEDETPVSWRLWTTEPIDSPEALARIVDLYRARWWIEEFFKALKTGCSYERRQLESRFTLLNALGLYIPVACKILSLKTLGRGPERDFPATVLMSENTLQALGAATKCTLNAGSTVRDAMLAVASLGGHIKNNGEPGWQVLWRGYQEFLVFQTGWEAARQQARCDQS